MEAVSVSDGFHEANGRFAKSNKAASYAAARRRKEGLWRGLPEKALRTYDRLLECGIPAVEAAVAKDILDREYGKPRQMAQVDVRTTDMTALHLAALKALASIPKEDIEIKELPPIDVKALSNGA